MCSLQLLLLLLLLIFCSSVLANLRLPAYLYRHMNVSSAACVDFYEHACGNWAKVHAERGYYSQLEQLDHIYHARLATLLEQHQTEEEPRFVLLLRQSYAACRRLQGRYEAAQFVRWLRQWSNIAMDRQDDDYSQLLRLLISFGLKAQSELELESEWQFQWESQLQPESLEAELWLLQQQLPWPDLAEDVTVDAAWADTDFQPLSRNQFRRLYKALQPLGVPQSKLWQEVKQLEQQLLQLQVELHAKEDVYVKPPARWLLPLPQSLLNVTLLPATVWQRYLGQLQPLLAVQSASLLARYLQLRLLHKLELLPQPTFGRQECATQSRQLLTHAAVWLLEQQQPQEQRLYIHATMQQLFVQLRQQFEQRLLQNRNRFSAVAQRFLLEKLRRMRLQLGVLPEGKRDENQNQDEDQLQQLETHYAQLQLNGSDYFNNLLHILQQFSRWAGHDKNKENKSELYLLQADGYGSYASPFFMPARNLLLLPHSLLATPLYRPHQPKIYTHSAIGFLIAHELSHGFAPSDVYYDGRGKLSNSLQQSRLLISHRFSTQLRCLRRQHGVMVDEKFADINGLALAYDSYFATPPGSPQLMQQQQLQQIFFLNFAQFFCQNDQQLEESNIHGGSRQRVNEAVASFQPFAESFGCAQNQNRNPSQHQHQSRKSPSCQLY